MLSWLEYLHDNSFKQQAARYENFLEGNIVNQTKEKWTENANWRNLA